jgi:hypothetical protein
MKRAFLTGCDKNTEWTLKWFVEGFKKHNDTPLIIADFGMTKEMSEYAKKAADLYIVMDTVFLQGWMLKPQAMMSSPAEETCWIDTDCEVFGDISGIFKYIQPEKLTMAEDRPWSKRQKEKWHNSGIVAFRGKPRVLQEWVRICGQKPVEGDQECLHYLLGAEPLTRLRLIEDLPHKYNVLRLDILDQCEPKEKLVMHWTGYKGKWKIKEQIKNGR